MTRDTCLEVVSVGNSVSQRWVLLWICSALRAFPDFPGLSLCGTVGEASTSWCLGHGRHALPFWRQDLSLLLPALSRHGSNSMARGHGRCEKGRRNRASDTFSAVSNLIHSISRFINVCVFSLPNLTASWKIKGLLDQQIINQSNNQTCK